MKKTCFGCKALDQSHNYSYYCSLNFGIQATYKPKTGLIDTVKPLEICPKPQTTKELFLLLTTKTN